MRSDSETAAVDVVSVLTINEGDKRARDGRKGDSLRPLMNERSCKILPMTIDKISINIFIYYVHMGWGELHLYIGPTHLHRCIQVDTAGQVVTVFDRLSVFKLCTKIIFCKPLDKLVGQKNPIIIIPFKVFPKSFGYGGPKRSFLISLFPLHYGRSSFYKV